MKRFLSVLVLVFSLLPGCQNDADDLSEGKIIFVKTIPGGCNNQDINEIKRSSVYPDTVKFTVRNDTLDIFVGINYICCAPFVTEAEIVDGSVVMTLVDNCPAPYQGCYCKCMCYYTWDFLFTDFDDKEYNYQVILTDPRESGPVIFKEGVFEIR